MIAKSNYFFEILINNKKYFIKNITTILNACYLLKGLQIPRFCYHEKLGIAGNCRLCLVEITDRLNNKKLVPSCTTQIYDQMIINTDTEAVINVRKNIIEYLLRTHPLDCPVCDKGGNCDLQDETLTFNADKNRYLEFKPVKDLIITGYSGAIIKTVMNRCIDCTKCLRFIEKTTDKQNLTNTGRGKVSKVALYIDKNINTELSGNLSDICPVGALITQVTSSRLRPWDLKIMKTTDIFDPAGYAIIVQHYNYEQIYVKPYHNELISNEWLTDKTRFAYDATIYNRLDYPEYYNRNTKISKIISWKLAFKLILFNIKTSFKLKNQFKAVIGDFIDGYMLYYLKNLFNSIGSNNIYFQEPIKINNDFRSQYLFNTNLLFFNYNEIKYQYEKNSLIRRVCFLIGTNLRFESPSLNNKVRELVKKKRLLVITLGSYANLTYFTYNLGNNIKTLINIFKGRHYICKLLIKNRKLNLTPILIIGNNILKRYDSLSILDNLSKIIKYIDYFYKQYFLLLRYKGTIEPNYYSGFNLLSPTLTQVTLLDMGINSLKKINYNKLGLLYLAGTNGYSLAKNVSENIHFIVYQGHHYYKPKLMHENILIDLKLPTTMVSEKNSFYINIAGVMKTALKIRSTTLNFLLDDWYIIKSISKFLLKNSKKSLQTQLIKNYPIFSILNIINLKITNKYKSFDKRKYIQKLLPLIKTNLINNNNLTLYLLIPFLHKSNLNKFQLLQNKLTVSLKYYNNKIFMISIFNYNNNFYEMDNISQASKIMAYSISENFEDINNSLYFKNSTNFYLE